MPRGKVLGYVLFCEGVSLQKSLHPAWGRVGLPVLTIGQLVYCTRSQTRVKGDEPSYRRLLTRAGLLQIHSAGPGKTLRPARRQPLQVPLVVTAPQSR